MAVCRLHFIRRICVDPNIPEREKPVKLQRRFSPAAGLDHQIRRPFPLKPVFRKLTENRPVFSQSGIADKKLDKESFVLAGFRILRREGVPPPVISLTGQRPVKHKGISGNIVLVEHHAPLAYRLLVKRAESMGRRPQPGPIITAYDYTTPRVIFPAGRHRGSGQSRHRSKWAFRIQKGIRRNVPPQEADQSIPTEHATLFTHKEYCKNRGSKLYFIMPRCAFGSSVRRTEKGTAGGSRGPYRLLSDDRDRGKRAFPRPETPAANRKTRETDIKE